VKNGSRFAVRWPRALRTPNTLTLMGAHTVRIALLGTGLMGTQLGRHLLAAGHELRVWNRTEEAVQGAEAVVTVLFGPPAVRDTVFGPNLLAEGTLWLDVSTVGPEDADRFGAAAREHGVRYVAAPVLGSMVPAENGELGVLLGGAAADVAAARELALLWGDPEKIREFGTAREAAAGKLVANLALAVAIEGVAEALQLASDTGLDRDVTLALLAGSVLAPAVAAKKRQLSERDFDEPEFTADALHKDMELILSSTLGLHAVQAAHDALESAQQDGRGGEDFSVIADV